MPDTKYISVSLNELEHLIEQKLLELLGDPDSGLELRPDFKKRLKERFKTPFHKISHKEVMNKYG